MRLISPRRPRYLTGVFWTPQCQSWPRYHTDATLRSNPPPPTPSRGPEGGSGQILSVSAAWSLAPGSTGEAALNWLELRTLSPFWLRDKVLSGMAQSTPLPSLLLETPGYSRSHSKGKYQVWLGRHNLFDDEDTAQHITVSKGFPHPQFNMSLLGPHPSDPQDDYSHDLMLLRLKEPARITDSVQVLPLPREAAGTEWGEPALCLRLEQGNVWSSRSSPRTSVRKPPGSESSWIRPGEESAPRSHCSRGLRVQGRRAEPEAADSSAVVGALQANAAGSRVRIGQLRPGPWKYPCRGHQRLDHTPVAARVTLRGAQQPGEVTWVGCCWVWSVPRRPQTGSLPTSGGAGMFKWQSPVEETWKPESRNLIAPRAPPAGSEQASQAAPGPSHQPKTPSWSWWQHHSLRFQPQTPEWGPQSQNLRFRLPIPPKIQTLDYAFWAQLGHLMLSQRLRRLRRCRDSVRTALCSPLQDPLHFSSHTPLSLPAPEMTGLLPLRIGLSGSSASTGSTVCGFSAHASSATERRVFKETIKAQIKDPQPSPVRTGSQAIGRKCVSCIRETAYQGL
ncbi:uncharacterized protein LOC104873802 [Fukomys damarensis]|uniref:uncharacterized protein LOC104873802 n=1 Tax=Fukomys damarensis TaxID=885580 RepID=UPI001454EAC1|nr:uncharacterized protein LOC104873802 [Fukomys damarensis]